MKNQWTKDNLHIQYTQPWVTPFSDGDEEDREVKTIDDAMYFYYNILIRHGEETLLSLSTHDFPKVQHLPNYIDTIMQLGKKKMFLMDNYKDGGFHRTIHYAQIVLDDGIVDQEYFYKIERYDYAVKQSGEKTYTKWTTYELTIGEREYKESFSKTVTIKYIKPDELTALKNTAKAFCEDAILQYNQNSND